MVATREEGRLGQDEKGKRGQICGDGRPLDFGWWAHTEMDRGDIIELHTWKLYILIIQRHPSTFNNTKKKVGSVSVLFLFPHITLGKSLSLLEIQLSY